MSKNIHTDIGETERTINYIQFQLTQAESALDLFQNTDKPKICFAHLLEWKRNLQSELYEIRKAQKAARFQK